MDFKMDSNMAGFMAAGDNTIMAKPTLLSVTATLGCMEIVK